MTTTVNNDFVNVATYADPKLITLQNQNCLVATANHTFEGFEFTKNLGNAVNLELPPRAITSNGLVINLQPIQQRLVPLVIDQAFNVAEELNTQQFIFNAKDYMQKFGKARMTSLGGSAEINIGLNMHSAVPVMQIINGQSYPTGQLHNESGPYRFYGNPNTPINSLYQLAQMEMLFRDYGSAPDALQVYLPNTAIPNIINTAGAQFVLDRNEKLFNSWDLGGYTAGNCKFYRSNLLPIHYSGTCGDNQDTLTLTGFNDPTGRNITQLTFSGVSANAYAFQAGDLLQFDTTANGGLWYRTFTNYQISANAVQVRILEGADATGGSVTVSIFPALQWTPGLNQNLSIPLATGMTASAVSSHRCGMVVTNRAFYVVMPKLPSMRPFDSWPVSDPLTKASMRTYIGVLPGQNLTMYVDDMILGSLVVPEDSMRLCFPINP